MAKYFMPKMIPLPIMLNGHHGDIAARMQMKQYKYYDETLPEPLQMVGANGGWIMMAVTGIAMMKRKPGLPECAKSLMPS
jgi:hypothetical protein